MNPIYKSMSVYETIKTMPDGQRERLLAAGIIPRQWERYIAIYEYVLLLQRGGMKAMDAYERAGERYFTCLENIRVIVRKMNKQV